MLNQSFCVFRQVLGSGAHYPGHICVHVHICVFVCLYIYDISMCMCMCMCVCVYPQASDFGQSADLFVFWVLCVCGLGIQAGG